MSAGCAWRRQWGSAESPFSAQPEHLLPGNTSVKGATFEDSTELPIGSAAVDLASTRCSPCAHSVLTSTHRLSIRGCTPHSHKKKLVPLEAKLFHWLVSDGAGVKVKTACPTTWLRPPGRASPQGVTLIWGPDFEMGVFKHVELQMALQWRWFSPGGRGEILLPRGTLGNIRRHFGLSQPEVG